MNRLRLRALAAGLAALLGCSACLVYPDRGFADEQQRRGDTPSAVRGSLIVGRTTREDVLCALGQPEYVSPDGARLVYWVHVTRWVTIVYIVLDAAQSVSGDDEFLLLEFDAQGVLRSQREVTRGFDSGTGNSGTRSAAEFEKLFGPLPR